MFLISICYSLISIHAHFCRRHGILLTSFSQANVVKTFKKLNDKLWIDHNGCDPGIKLLELLCYAIINLGYRTGFTYKRALVSGFHTLIGNDNTYL